LTIRAAAARTLLTCSEQVKPRVTIAAPEAVVQPGDLPAIMLGLRVQVAEETLFESRQT